MAQKQVTKVKTLDRTENLKRAVGIGSNPDGAKIKAGLGKRDGLGDFVSAVTAAINCPLFNMPVVEQVRWTMDGPQTDASIIENFGSEIDLFGSGKSPEGISFVETTMAQPGQLQTYMITCALFLHLEPEMAVFTANGNAWTHPTTGSAQPGSPDVWTINDLVNGALGAALAGGTPTQIMVPAVLEWGWWWQEAFWNLVRGYNLRWKVGQQTNIMDEVARHSAYTPPNAQEGSASDSEQDIIAFVRRVNNYYEANGSTLDFLKVDRVRIGSVGAGAANLGVFRPSRDFERVGVTYGGGSFRSLLSGNKSEYRKLSVPYLIKPGVPIGLILQENDPIQAGHMREFLSITQGLGGAIPPQFTDAGNINAGATNGTTGGTAFLERTLDGLNVTQQMDAQRAIYKGGEGKISLGVKGFYVTDDWGDFLRANPDVQAVVASDCGINFT